MLEYILFASMKKLPVALSYFLVPCTTSLYSYFVQVRASECTNFKKLYEIKAEQKIGGARRESQFCLAKILKIT